MRRKKRSIRKKRGWATRSMRKTIGLGVHALVLQRIGTHVWFRYGGTPHACGSLNARRHCHSRLKPPIRRPGRRGHNAQKLHHRTSSAPAVQSVLQLHLARDASPWLGFLCKIRWGCIRASATYSTTVGLPLQASA